MNLKTERFEMRLDQNTLERIDQWRTTQEGLPSRAEAIRRLIDMSLDGDATEKKVKLSDGERLILAMLCDQHKALNIDDGEIDAEFVSSAIYSGHHWALKWKYNGIFNYIDDKENIVSEVVNILDMWLFLVLGYEKLSSKDKKEIDTAYGEISFRGFDGNNETEHLGVAQFLVDKLGRFQTFKNRIFNSHMPTLQKYRSMLRVFLPIRETLVGRGLSAKEILNIVNA